MKKNLIFNIIIGVMSVVFAITLLGAVATLAENSKRYGYETDSMLYYVESGDYAWLLRNMYNNEAMGMKADADMQECYAVARYFEAATKYKAYAQAGEDERAAAQQTIMDGQEALMGELSFAADDIDAILK